MSKNKQKTIFDGYKSEKLNVVAVPGKINNPLRLDLNLVSRVLPFLCARNDFYWKYSHKGVPFTEKKSFNFQDIVDHVSGKEVYGFSPFLDNETIASSHVDFDAHTSKKLTEEENNKKVVEAKEDSEKVYEFLDNLNLPVILNSSGSSGRHVRLLCYGANARDMRIFMQYVLDKTLGNEEKHEIFPKQDNLNENRKYGNQIKGCFGKHQKKNKRSNIILNNKELDLFDSLKYAASLVDKYNEFSPIVMEEKDYKKFEAQEKRNRILRKYKKSEYNFDNAATNVPKVCKVFEEIFSKVPVPSAGKHTRHQSLDPNIASYGLHHPEVRNRYQEVQERHSNTAIDNWKNYWVNNKPIFSCPQIIGFLKTYAKENDACARGLDMCLNCPRFKEYISHKKPRGWAKTLNIKKIAKKRNILNCPKCKNPFEFNERLGWFKCTTCSMFGGIKKLMGMSMEISK